MLFYILLLAYKNAFKVSSQNRFAAAEMFGFQANGTYVLYGRNSTQPIIFGLLPKNQITSFVQIPSQEDYCPPNLSDPNSKSKYVFSRSQILLLSNEEQVRHGSVDSKDIYYLFFFSCGSSQYSAIIYVEFGNPGTKLDTREFPLLILNPIALTMYAILLVLWLLNWIMNRHLKVYLHYLLSSVFILALLTSIARYYVLLDRSKYDIRMSVQWIYPFLNVLFLCDTFLFYILAASGWCIICESIPITKVFCSIIFSSCFLIFYLVVNFVDLKFIHEGIFIFCIVAFTLCSLLQLLLFRVQTSESFEYIESFRSNNIISKLPIPIHFFSKRTKSTFFIFFIFLIINFIIICEHYSLASDPEMWYLALLEDIRNIICLISFGIIFRLRKKYSDNIYLTINEPIEDTSESEVLENIDNVPNDSIGKLEPSLPLSLKMNEIPDIYI